MYSKTVELQLSPSKANISRTIPEKHIHNYSMFPGLRLSCHSRKVSYALVVFFATRRIPIGLYQALNSFVEHDSALLISLPYRAANLSRCRRRRYVARPGLSTRTLRSETLPLGRNEEQIADCSSWRILLA